jgi:hypothetical protein
MPGRSGVTVVTTLVRFFCCARGCGCIGHPAFPAPSAFKGERFMHSSGEFTPRECGVVFEIVSTSLRGAKRRSNPPFVIPGWSEGPDLRCAIAHRGISRFRARCFASPRNDGLLDCFAEPVIGRAFARPVGEPLRMTPVRWAAPAMPCCPPSRRHRSAA